MQTLKLAVLVLILVVLMCLIICRPCYILIFGVPTYRNDLVLAKDSDILILPVLDKYLNLREFLGKCRSLCKDATLSNLFCSSEWAEVQCDCTGGYKLIICVVKNLFVIHIAKNGEAMSFITTRRWRCLDLSFGEEVDEIIKKIKKEKAQPFSHITISFCVNSVLMYWEWN